MQAAVVLNTQEQVGTCRQTQHEISAALHLYNCGATALLAQTMLLVCDGQAGGVFVALI